MAMFTEGPAGLARTNTDKGSCLLLAGGGSLLVQNFDRWRGNSQLEVLKLAIRAKFPRDASKI